MSHVLEVFVLSHQVGDFKPLPLEAGGKEEEINPLDMPLPSLLASWQKFNLLYKLQHAS